MGRPGAGGARPGGSMGSMHKIGGSSGSMHRVGGSVSRPTASSINKPRPMSQNTRPTGSNNSRPSMNSFNTMMGGSNKSERREEQHRDTRRKDEMRMPPPMGMPRQERVVIPPPPPPRRETVIITPQPRRETTHTTVINNTYINGDSESYTSGTTNRTTSRVESSSTPSYSSATTRSNRSVSAESDDRKNNGVKTILGLTAIITVTLLVFAILFRVAKSEEQETALSRVKLDTGYSYMNNCIDDELGWLNENKVSKGLRSFYEDTGAQPYIWLRAYDGKDLSDSEAYDIARGYYDDNFADRQDVVLYVYFEESDPYVEGNMALIHGLQSGSIMDSEAEEIFWNYLDDAWATYGENETDEMFIAVFKKTGNSIMYHRTNGWDVLSSIFILLSVASLCFTVLIAIVLFHRRSREKAAEMERISKMSLDELAAEKQKDELLEKYK